MGTEKLEDVLGYLYRDIGSIQRIAENAGLDVGKLALERTTPVTAWHNVLIEAEQQGRMSEVYAIAHKEHANYAALVAAWADYESDMAGATETPQPARRRPPPAMSDNYRQGETVRIDQLQRDLATVQSQVAVLVEQNKTIIAQQQHAADSQVAMQRRLLWLFGFLVVSVAIIGVMVAVHITGGSTHEIARSGVDNAFGGLAVIGGVVWGLLRRDAVGAGSGGSAVDHRQDN